MTPGSSSKPWSRRQRVLYGLFLVAVAVALGLVTRAVDADNWDAAGGVVAVAGIVAVVVFIVWVVRLLRDR